MKLMMLAASLRQNSCNKKLIQLAANMAEAQDVTVDLANFADFNAPLYNGDIQDNQGFPAEVMHFVQRMQQADGLIIASPEYNFSVPGTLKNLIDWVSRISPMPWRNQSILLLSASPSLVGGNRGLWATRIPLETCGAFVYPDMYSLASAYSAFNEAGNLIDQQASERLQQLIYAYVNFTVAIKNR